MSDYILREKFSVSNTNYEDGRSKWFVQKKNYIWVLLVVFSIKFNALI